MASPLIPNDFPSRSPSKVTLNFFKLSVLLYPDIQLVYLIEKNQLRLVP
ncbi:hypothetical protein UUU_07090 [Klebsiella pneumoniae subsp. pneumoniae DSM 30104 = JCM 1662 = NBRC 14940]|nr:hypothetical protein UUU_07090 [Klebsiella pneumoniae subsp. pneumoniae DSM 30104 = JCM 1662 = NBRC 14940]